jgi:DNA-directed RNA polymerase III subunit RPC2
MECYVYQGPIFYQRLRHMVADKIHARSTGPYQTLTRQPVEGRARNGGQRVGEMERDCLVAYGASNLLVERLLLSSDVFHIYVCEICGLFKSGPHCDGCNTDKVYKVRLPYACKVML